MSKPVKVTIEHNGETEVYECDAFVGAAVYRSEGPTGLMIESIWMSMDYFEILRAMSVINFHAYSGCVLPFVEEHEGGN